MPLQEFRPETVEALRQAKVMDDAVAQLTTEYSKTGLITVVEANALSAMCAASQAKTAYAMLMLRVEEVKEKDNDDWRNQ